MGFVAMPNNPYSGSLEARVLSATPLELVVILYDGAIDAVRAARAHLAAGEIFPRSRAVTQAVKIITELRQSLNFETGGDLSKRLAGVYGFMQSSLLEANFRQTDDGMAITEKILVSLREAWHKVSAQTPAVSDAIGTVPAPDFPWGAMGESASPSRCWSA
jgi:flagellar secretion chaperone FliS